jgi:hypothetical protein
MPLSVTCVLFDQGPKRLRLSSSKFHAAPGKAFALHWPVAVSFALVVERSVRCFFVYPPRPVLKNSPRHTLHAVLTAAGFVAIIDLVGGFVREACDARLKIVGALGRE